MRRTTSRWIAAVSAILLAGALAAARRPRYGGTLRIETGASVQSLDPAEAPADPLESYAKSALAGLVFENLVRFDEHGRVQPALALSWTHDTARRRWIFNPRPNVTLHNGSRWTPDTLSFPDDRPIDAILRDLARPRNAIATRMPDGTLTGSGPFAVSRWDAGKSAVFTAHETYWGGRPYLDSVEVQMGRADRQQSLDLESGKADVIEAGVTDLRRLQQRNARTAVSPLVEVIALVLDGPRPITAPVAEALGLSIDRNAIQSVLMQRQGLAAASLLPQWLSGYGFVFPPGRDLGRARQLAAGAMPLTISYDRNDTLARSVAERVAVNAGEAGLSVRAAPGSGADARVARLRIASNDPRTALEDLAAQLKLPVPVLDNLYAAERSVLGPGKVIPLVDLPLVWQLSPQVRDWNPRWRLEDVWLDTGAAP
jgi:peptide/nickel transport system substrate-binding protein